MTTLREAAQQALEALEWHLDRGTWGADIEGVTGALRAALAEPQSTHSEECYQWHHKCAVAEVKRLRAALAEPVQEPVAVFDEQWGQPVLLSGAPLLTDEQPLYAAPPQRKPLTPQQATDLVQSVVSNSDRPIGMVAYGLLVVRALERAHGIGGEA